MDKINYLIGIPLTLGIWYSGQYYATKYFLGKMEKRKGFKPVSEISGEFLEYTNDAIGKVLFPAARQAMKNYAEKGEQNDGDKKPSC